VWWCEIPRTERALNVGVGLVAPPAFQPLPSALRPPRITLDLIERQALVATLATAYAPLVVVSAPAGWGKTTVLQQWSDGESRPHAWLQLDAAHNDPLGLLVAVAAALGQVAPVDPMVAQWTRLAAPPVRERILPSLQASLERASSFLLVLDDAHLLTDKVGWEIVEVLLRAFPSGAQLALGTRTQPPLPLARLRAGTGLLEVGHTELALDARETAELLHLRGLDVDEQTAAALQTTTEGWAAGISLAALVCDGPRTANRLAAIRGDQRDIARYLTTEVLERQTPEVREFLLQTSIVECLSASLCRAVTGDDDAGATLTRLAHDNVFLASLDDNGTWYRYHQLFAELLRSELERRAGARLPELHRRAADWCEDHDQLEDAVRHRLAAGEVNKAAAIVCRAYITYSGQAQIETIRRWIELFSDEQILSDVPLTLTAGWVASMTGDARTGRLWENAALSERVDDSLMPDGTATQRASQAALRAGVAPDGVRHMREDAELAATLVTESHPAYRSATNTILGVARWLSGDTPRAQAALQRAVEVGAAFNVIAEIGALGYLALVLADEGRWGEAEIYAEQAERRFAESELGLIGPMLVVPVAQERMLAHRSAPAAEGQVETVARAFDHTSTPAWMAVTMVVVLAEAALERGDLKEVERWTASGMMTLRTWPDTGILRGRLDRLRRAVEERRLAGHLTPAERRVLAQLATHRPETEIARTLQISQNTLKTHVRGLYRKLDVHSRSEAVERAREIGLLTGL
jgi:LuxR family maltose regulon positive regulatory protein